MPHTLPIAMATQRETLSLYTSLAASRPHWHGALLLIVGMDRALALAALAAGSATLILEDDPALVRDARQDVTFTVTTLDEALRALKNEVRQRRAITVALPGDPARWLQEMEERGVLPDAVAWSQRFEAHAAASYPLVPRVLPPSESRSGRQTASAIAEDGASTLKERSLRDAGLIAAHPRQRQWLLAAPALFPRDLTRAYLLDQ